MNRLDIFYWHWKLSQQIKNISGNYEVESDGTIVCSFTKCIDSFPPNGPTEIQGYTAKFVLNSDGTLTSPTGSNGTTNWGKNTTWTKVQ